ncbi:YdcF family protein [Patescibacteria group bacterium]|nr:YdcF family protein [Patescibacteria group bacterium]
MNKLSSSNTLQRCKKGLKLWESNQYDYIVTSGGLYNDKSIQTVPAADIMKNWLITHGIEKEKILSENKSLDTYTNIHYALSLLKKKNIKIASFTIVSHWTHLIRFRIIFLRNYKVNIICIPVKYQLGTKEYFYEFFMFLYHFFDKIGNGLFEKKIRESRRKKAIT